MNITMYTNSDSLANMIDKFIAYHHIHGDVIKVCEVYIGDEHIKQNTYKIVLYNTSNLYTFGDCFRIDYTIDNVRTVSIVIDKNDINVVDVYVDMKAYDIDTLIKEK